MNIRLASILTGISGLTLTAAALLAEPWEPSPALLTVMACSAAAWLAALHLSRQVTQRTAQVDRVEQRSRTGLRIVETLALAIDARDLTSAGHLRRLRIYAREIGRRLGMSSDELDALDHAALLHDVGKIVVPDSVPSRAGDSSDAWALKASHAEAGAMILDAADIPAAISVVVRHHHERYGGGGAPDGLIGMEIPLGARVLAVAETFEALTSDRSLHHPMAPGDAVQRLEELAGSHLDPRVVGILVRDLDEIIGLARREATGEAETTLAVQRVMDRIASAHAQLYHLHEVGRALGRPLDPHECFNLLSERIARLVRFDACVFYLLDEDRTLLTARDARGEAASRFLSASIPVDAGVSGRAAALRRAVRTSGEPEGGNQTEPQGDPSPATAAATLAAPLECDGELIGVFTLYRDGASLFSPSDAHLIELLAGRAAPALRDGLRIEQMNGELLIDPATGLPNDRYLRLCFGREIARSRGDRTPLSLMRIDVDGFEELAGRIGTSAGNRIIGMLGHSIRLGLRVADTCARTSAGTFVAMLPGLDRASAELVADRLRDRVRLPAGVVPAHAGVPFITIGVACAPEDGADLPSLMTVLSENIASPTAASGFEGIPALSAPAAGEPS